MLSSLYLLRCKILLCINKRFENRKSGFESHKMYLSDFSIAYYYYHYCNYCNYYLPEKNKYKYIFANEQL